MPIVQFSVSDEVYSRAWEEGRRFDLSPATMMKYFYIACTRTGIAPTDEAIREAKNWAKAKQLKRERLLVPLPGIEPFNSKWKGYRG